MIKDGYDALRAAELAEANGEIGDAELLFLRSIRLSAEKDDLSRVSSRAAYISFLLRQNRVAIATPNLRDLLEDAGDHLDAACSPLVVLFYRVNEKDAVNALRTMQLDRFFDEWSLLSASEKCAKTGRFRVAEALANTVREAALIAGDDDNRWRAEGQLGRVYAREGKTSEAVELWQRAFREGSANRVIADQLSLHLERTKQYGACALVIRHALRRINNPKMVELLRRRLERVQKKSSAVSS